MLDDSPATRTQSMHIQSITTHALERLLRSRRRVLVVDVREPSEIARSGEVFPDACRIPVHHLFVHRDRLRVASYDSIIVVSNEDERSRSGAFTLSLLGGRDVRWLEGGLAAWMGRRVAKANSFAVNGRAA